MQNEQMGFNVGIVGLGVYLPEKRMTEQDFIDAGVPKWQIDEWGVYEHRVSEPEESSSEMSIRAAKDLIQKTGIDPKEIDLIIDCALVPDYIHPSNSYKIQYEIGTVNAAAFDIAPSGGGAATQIMLAKALVETGEYSNVLLTCSSKFTAVADTNDWLSVVVGGDGAAAALISKVGLNKGILSSNIITLGEFYSNSGIKYKNQLNTNSRGMIYEVSNSKLLFFLNDATFISNVEDEERKRLDDFVFKSVPLSAQMALRRTGMTYDDVDFWITHQSATGLYKHWLKSVGVSTKGNYYYTNHKYGNLFMANLLVNLKEAVELSLIQDNDIIVLGGLVSGFSAGTVVIKWGK